jgi:metallo-beta-lactamase class B
MNMDSMGFLASIITPAVVMTASMMCDPALAGSAQPKRSVWSDAWSQAQEPVRIFGNTYYVGTRGLSSVLITSEAGHVLIDGTLPETVSQLLANIRAIGFDPADIKFILNSHAHFDHAGGIAELQKFTGATVVSSASGAAALRGGRGGTDDPQYDLGDTFPAAANLQILADRDTLQLGSITLQIHYTPGHTPGGTSWTWQSCEASRCVQLVYADSLNAVSSESFRYSGDARYPNAGSDLQQSINRIRDLRCDVLISAHPEASQLWEKVERRKSGEREALIAPGACRAYAEGARQRFDARLEKERTQRAE